MKITRSNTASIKSLSSKSLQAPSMGPKRSHQGRWTKKIYLIGNEKGTISEGMMTRPVIISEVKSMKNINLKW